MKREMGLKTAKRFVARNRRKRHIYGGDGWSPSDERRFEEAQRVITKEKG